MIEHIEPEIIERISGIEIDDGKNLTKTRRIDKSWASDL